jgi:DNA polymerase-3 subunit gamma/tau
MPHTDDTHYTVLARRFRPQTFDEVVGQEHVGQALRNAIRSGRVAHAYLFTGARGVGKTSTARIFAKALNCPRAVDAVPCNECDVCQGIAAGADVDVLEIDGASNRGIDDIRTLRANVNVRSMRSRYKVYIIDEVHMLTREAFNALLKTLEEPPPNVKFVFCTTEPNKVPDTILSRCQRFDFGLIAAQSITARLDQIAAAEGVEVDPDAVSLVARRAAGSMRDAQSLFDQLLAFGSDRITPDDVHRLLGTAPDERLVELVAALIRRDAATALGLVEAALAAGAQLGSLSDQLLEYLRDLLVVGVGADAVSLASVSPRLRSTLHGQIAEWGLPTTAAAMQILVDAKGRMQRVNYGRALLELGIVRICILDQLTSLAEAVRVLGDGGGRTPPKAAAASPTAGSNPAVRSATRPQSTTPIRVGPSRMAEPVPDAKMVTSDAPSNESHASVSIAADEPVIDLLPATIDAFWAQLLVQAQDTIASHLKNATRIAILGPNALELVFPKSYSFSKNYCERPDTLRKIQALAQELAGRSVEFRLSFDESDVAAETSRVTAPPVRRTLDSVSKDPFVQQVMSIFGGTLVDARFGPAATSGEG